MQTRESVPIVLHEIGSSFEDDCRRLLVRESSGCRFDLLKDPEEIA
jgi:hypothetical protein